MYEFPTLDELCLGEISSWGVEIDESLKAISIPDNLVALELRYVRTLDLVQYVIEQELSNNRAQIRQNPGNNQAKTGGSTVAENFQGRGYKLDSTRERELESEHKTIAGGYEPQENVSKVSNIPVDNKSSLDTKYPAPEKSLRKYLRENIKMQLRKPEVSATSPEIKIVDTNSPDKDKSGTSSFKDDTLQNIKPIKIDVPRNVV
ncbi:15978_t:CDS:2 [Entrophospora sp. SA101]|nr:15978_t:CDS:2 [Entrophospora sp. SA101]